jgi:nucleoside-diphosphate kinase
MPIERTLSIIKPDAVEKNLVGEITSRFEAAGLRVAGARMLRMSTAQAADFYSVHSQRPFFERLVNFMASGPSMVQILEGPDAVRKNRELMGATNPRKAAPGTIRYDFAREVSEEEMHKNAVHGSDSVENAEAEIRFFFQPGDVCRRY